MEEIVLRPMQLEDQEMVMAWRIMPQITKYMNTDSTSDIEKQRAWFLKQQEAKEKGYQWIIMRQGKPIGVTSITEIDRVNGTCTRGTYVADEAERSFQMITDIYANQQEFVFQTLGLEKMWIHVFEENKYVVKLNKMCGFKQTNILNNHITKNGKSYNVVELELTKSDWEEKKKKWNYNKIDIIYEEN